MGTRLGVCLYDGRSHIYKGIHVIPHFIGAQEGIVRILPASTSRLPQGNLPADGQVLVSL